MPQKVHVYVKATFTSEAHVEMGEDRVTTLHMHTHARVLYWTTPLNKDYLLLSSKYWQDNTLKTQMQQCANRLGGNVNGSSKACWGEGCLQSKSSTPVLHLTILWETRLPSGGWETGDLLRQETPGITDVMSWPDTPCLVTWWDMKHAPLGKYSCQRHLNWT